MLEPDWLAAHAGAFDVLHVHFGTEGVAPAQLREAVAALRAAGRPLVCTVHDLAHPQLADPHAHDAQLDVLLPAADALVTLTAGAAAEVARRWGRSAEVLPHPHVLPLDAPLLPGRAAGERVVGLDLRDLRPNVDGPGSTAALLAALPAGARARVTLHDRVRDPVARDAVRRLCAGRADVELRERPRPGDAPLHAELADLDVAVLPYRHGTHSGWLELCWDLGVAVATPAVGHFAEQHHDPTVATFASAEALGGALRALLAAAPRPGSPARAELQRARREERGEAQARNLDAHLALYRGVMR